MAAPVWTLSVDLQTKTATFQSGMAEAAKSARNAFGEIKSGAGGMSSEIEHRSIDVRHSIGLVDNFIRGAHAQAIADLIRMYGKSAIVMGTLPLAATAAGIGLIGGIAYEVYEKMHKLREEEEKVADDTVKFGTVANTAFRALDDKLLQAEQRADELSGNHLAALHAQLTLIDHQSMNELVHSFGLVQKAADVVFADLKDHWYSFGTGSDGAKHALDQFQTQYESLLAQGNSKGASDLLAGTTDSAKKKLLALQKELAESRASMPHGIDSQDAVAHLLGEGKSIQQAALQKEIASQQQLVSALTDQMGIEQRITALKKQEGANATTQTGQEMGAKAAAAARESVESQLRMGESAISGDKATADARLTIQRASIEQRLQSDISFADRSRDVEAAANQAEIAALDKGGKDYASKLKTLQDKALEITQQHETAVAQLKAKAAEAEAARDLTALESAERQKIDATRQGGAARLAAVDAAIKEEESKHLQDTAFYRELLNQRADITRQMTEDEAKHKADMLTEAAAHQREMGEMQIAAERAAGQTSMALAMMTGNDKVQLEIHLANEEYENQKAFLNRKLAALDEYGKDYENKRRTFNDQLAELEQQHANRMTLIQQQAAGEQNSILTPAMTRMVQEYARGFSDVLMGKEGFGRMMAQIDSQIVGSMLQTAMKSAMAMDVGKEKEAAAAARKFYLAGAKFPFPVNLVMAPVLGAMAFASVMAFEKGGIVPGTGGVDTVPAMLTPGEGVVPKGVMDGLSDMARSGNMGGGGNHTTVHVHYRVNASALDGDGMATVLEKHSDQLQKHFENTLRRMNH